MQHYRPYLLSALPVALALVGCLCADRVLAQDAPPAWRYDAGPSGPHHWGDLDPGYEACAQGSYQSPIDIRAADTVDLPPLAFALGAADGVLKRYGPTPALFVSPGHTLALDGRTYDLDRIELHAPSEVAFLGKRADMEAQFHFRNNSGQTLVLEVLLAKGQANPHYGPLLKELKNLHDDASVQTLSLNLDTLLPTSRRYFTYQGSLSTPPCSEGVQWLILDQTLPVSAAQIRAFRAQFKTNARPLQNLNARVVQASE